MQAIWLENRQLNLQEVPTPSHPGEALIRIRKAGICSTDLELVKGYYPFTGILGHEFVGEVVECEDRSWVGRRVVADINVSCGKCEQCLGSRPTHCEKRSVLGIVGRDGAFAEYTTLPLQNLYPVPDSVPDDKAVFTEPLAAALEIQEQIQIKPTDRVLLIGAGRLGQLIAQTLVLTGCGLKVIARHAKQQELLLNQGIRLIREEDLPPARWDVVVEATGSPGGYSLARQAVRPRGTLVLKSTYRGEMSVDFSSVVVDEIKIVGSRCGPFAPALRLMELGEVDPSVLISADYKIEEGLEAFERAASAGTLKVLIAP